MCLINKQRGIVLSILVMLCVMMLSGCGSDDSKKVKKGDTIEFGGHNWIVLDVQDGKVLILSEKILKHREYHSQNVAVTWESSSIRKYLNTKFLQTFSPSDRKRILDTKVVTHDNPWYGTPGGAATTDKIFLLSLEEVVQYFGDSGKLKNRPGQDDYFTDQYNQSRIAYDKDGEDSVWWLRSPGAADSVSIISHGGVVGVKGDYAYYGFAGVRPALWLKLQ